MKHKVLCTDGFAGPGLDNLKADKNLEVAYRDSMPPERLAQQIEPYAALIVRSASKVSREVITAGKNLKIIARAGIGTDNIDKQAASQRGIFVVNSPGGNTVSAAELTFAMLLSLSRHIPQAAASMADGKWEKKLFKGNEVAHKTLGIIGLGRIGAEVAKRANAFEMKVIGYDPYIKPEKVDQLHIEPLALEQIYQQADYISVHTPLTEETRDLISAKELAQMKPTVRIVNTARGGIVNERDLAQALRQGTIAGAALDVFSQEPYTGDLFKGLKNCFVTPHLGASTSEAQATSGLEVANSIVRYFSEGHVENLVNTELLK